MAKNYNSSNQNKADKNSANRNAMDKNSANRNASDKMRLTEILIAKMLPMQAAKTANTKHYFGRKACGGFTRLFLDKRGSQ